MSKIKISKAEDVKRMFASTRNVHLENWSPEILAMLGY